MKTALDLIAEERRRQVDAEGWTHEHDDSDAHEYGEIATAAACYALPYDLREIERGVPVQWPWETAWWKPTPKDRIRELVKAGALIVAEIERLQRAAAPARDGAAKEET